MKDKPIINKAQTREDFQYKENKHLNDRYEKAFSCKSINKTKLFDLDKYVEIDKHEH